MKTSIVRKTVSLAVLFGALTLASSQAQVFTTLYDQDWGAGYGTTTPPLAGTLQQVGWSVIGGQYTGMYGQAGAFDVTTGVALSNRPVYFSSSIPSDVAIIYTQTGDGSGTNNNVAFADIDPTTNPGLFFSVDSQVNQNGTFGQTNYWAVKVNGSWYVSVAPMTNNAPATGPIYAMSTLTYNPGAGNWNTLTLGVTVTVGGPAGALSGNIQGIGIVQVWAATISGNTPGYNYLNLRIQKPIAIPADPTAPVIKGFGNSVTNYEGSVVSFAVNVPIGTAPLTYSWTLNGGSTLGNGATGSGSTIFGATTSQITISNISSADAGVYSVVVANASGSDDLANHVTNRLEVLTRGPEILYSEKFPFVGPIGNAIALSNVGWRITSPNGALPNRVAFPGQVYAYEPAARTMAFVTSSNWDNGVSGLTFPAAGINPANYPFVSFRATYAGVQNAGNAQVYFAVQMNAGGTTNWFVSTSANLVQNGTNGLQFSPVASGWNRLTLNLTGNATVGTVAPADLTGLITGVGLVFVTTAPAPLYFVTDVSLVTNSTPPIPPSFPSLPNVPYAQTVYAGGGVGFSFTEAGTLPFTNHWDFNGGPALLTDGVTASGSIISGSGSSFLVIQNVSSADAGSYRGVVSNPAGTSYTDTGIFGATPLTVVDPPVGFIYNEAFPVYGIAGSGAGVTGGNNPLSLIGWTNQSTTANGQFILFKNGAASVGTFAGFAFGNASTTSNSLYYASTQSDTGFSGLPFIAFNPAYYPPGSIQLSAQFASSGNFANVSASFAVRIGGNWYVTATPIIPTNSALTGTYTLYSQTFNPAAANWKNVTLSNGSVSVTIGGTPSAPLSGTIDAAGMLFQFINPPTGGTINFNSFAIQAIGVSGDNLIGGINIGPIVNGSTTLTWVGNPAVSVQTTTSLTPPVVWTPVPNTAGFHSLPVNAGGSQRFYRLVGPSVP
jgi:Immunoglobulin domain